MEYIVFKIFWVIFINNLSIAYKSLNLYSAVIFLDYNFILDDESVDDLLERKKEKYGLPCGRVVGIMERKLKQYCGILEAPVLENVCIEFEVTTLLLLIYILK